MSPLEIAKNPYVSLSVNIVYGISNCIIGFFTGSWWLITVGAYYCMLAATRFYVVLAKRRYGRDKAFEQKARRISGILLITLSVCIIGVNIMSAVKDRGSDLNEIIMITIATFTFAKITAAIIGLVRATRSGSYYVKILRNIALADAVVAVYSMQRSMLVSFKGMSPSDILLMNILTGTAVWIVVMLLGINLIGGKKVDMAKSKLAKANEKIAESVTGAYKKIENGVVDGYKKIESGVVDGYKKIEDKFVDAYLTKDGETVEEAKARLKNENKTNK